MKAATATELFEARRPGEPTAREVVDVLYAPDDRLLPMAAAVLDDLEAPAWRRRLLALRLRRMASEPSPPRPGPKVDPDAAVEYLDLRMAGHSHRAAVETMLSHPDADTRGVERRVARSRRVLSRTMRAHAELIEEALGALSG